MKDGTPEPRTPVMIMVEASWEDQSGTVQSTRARIENKSSGGACIRLNKKIAVGTRLRVEGQWERFSGEARYCRRDGRDYLVGIQKDKTEWPPAKRLAGKVEAPKGNSVLPDVEALMEQTRERERHKAEETAEDNGVLEGVPKTGRAEEILAAATPARETRRELWSRERRNGAQRNGLEGLERKEEQQQPSAEGEAGEERKHMRRKWFDMGHKEEKQEGLSEMLNGKEETAKRAPTTSVPAERFADAEETGPEVQLELLSVEDIYRMAGILNPCKGYSINKIVEMLHSDH